MTTIGPLSPFLPSAPSPLTQPGEAGTSPASQRVTALAQSDTTSDMDQRNPSQRDPRSAPPTILQLKISEMLNEQSSSVEADSNDADDPSMRPEADEATPREASNEDDLTSDTAREPDEQTTSKLADLPQEDDTARPT